MPEVTATTEPAKERPPCPPRPTLYAVVQQVWEEYTDFTKPHPWPKVWGWRTELPQFQYSTDRAKAENMAKEATDNGGVNVCIVIIPGDAPAPREPGGAA